ncbi:AlpA family transcriptional regulator [Bradyrhizobium septentrionale]|uniref:helix-turn-helix transcriptional regulator n=1 Tax=Bradyrhizobium septentrionale TaxID=1404411 RepID=UPI001596CF59|nr:AlpA family transcriptional regulator [Bradyrhizobium septentrionale]UGY27173.1 AlpA family transcriptional regulator [Bradyrhizobium septentrionale]
MLQRILRRPEVEAATGLKRSSIYEGMAAGTFPKTVPLSDKAVGWLESEIIAWQKARIAVRDGANEA